MLHCFDQCCAYIAGSLCPVVVMASVSSRDEHECTSFRRASDSVQHLLRASVAREMDEYMQWIAQTFPYSVLRCDGGSRSYSQVVKAFLERCPRTSCEYAELVDLFVNISEFRYANMAMVTFLEDMVRLMEKDEDDVELQGKMHQFIQQTLKEQPDEHINEDKTYGEVLSEFLGEVQQGTILYRRALFKFRYMGNVQEFLNEVAWLMVLRPGGSFKRASV